MLAVLKIFFRAPGANAWLVLGCLILASLSEGIGIASLLPLIASLVESPETNVSDFHQSVLDMYEALGLPKEFNVLLLFVVGFTLVKGVLMLFAMRYVGFAVAQVSTNFRMELIQNVLQARWSYFVSQPAGRIANAVGSEAVLAAAAFKAAADFLADVIQTLAYLALALFMSWKLSIAAIFVGGTIIFSLDFLVRRSRRSGEKQTHRTRLLMMHLHDLLGNIKPLKAMARQEASKAYLEDKLLRLQKDMRKQTTSIVVLKRAQEMMIVVALGVGLYFAVDFLNSDVAELLVMIVVTMRVIKNVARIQRQYQMAATVEAPYRAIQEIIEDTQSAREPTHKGRSPEFRKFCDFENVSFAFDDKKILKGVNLRIPARGVTVLMGSSGAGKTTLTDILLGLYEPTEGSILVDGVSLEQIDLHRWKQMIGYVPQELHLLHDSVFANVSLGDKSIDETQVCEALTAAGAMGFVSELPNGIYSLVGERGSRLSGGQRQRIALARALVAKPRLLILDEVTSALDPVTEREICATLEALSRETSILAITHQSQFLEIADRGYRVKNGTVEEIELDSSVAI